MPDKLYKYQETSWTEDFLSSHLKWEHHYLVAQRIIFLKSNKKLLKPRISLFKGMWISWHFHIPEGLEIFFCASDLHIPNLPVLWLTCDIFHNNQISNLIPWNCSMHYFLPRKMFLLSIQFLFFKLQKQ